MKISSIEIYAVRLVENPVISIRHPANENCACYSSDLNTEIVAASLTLFSVSMTHNECNPVWTWSLGISRILYMYA